MFLEVTKADYVSEFKLRVEFNDGSVKTVDLQDQLQGKVFEPLHNLEYFKSFALKYNTIEWDNGADFAPEFLYKIGIIDQTKDEH